MDTAEELAKHAVTAHHERRTRQVERVIDKFYGLDTPTASTAASPPFWSPFRKALLIAGSILWSVVLAKYVPAFAIPDQLYELTIDSAKAKLDDGFQLTPLAENGQ